MISLLLGLLVAVRGELEQLDCGRSCLMQCRNIAISCVGDGVSTSDFMKLMKCVYDRSQEDAWEKNDEGDNCFACIERERQTLSFEERNICLKAGEVDQSKCEDIESPDTCDSLSSNMNCASIADSCWKIRPGKMRKRQYKTIVKSLDEKECEMFGGKLRERGGKTECSNWPLKKLRCGFIGRRTKAGDKMKDGDYHNLEKYCSWFPHCEWSKNKGRCKGEKQPFN